jgi:DNA (cytosine-5)-methyltransferase 1
MTQPRALDLFCGAGGATKGLQRAGFHVTGVDIAPQPRYCGDAFIQADAMTMDPYKIRKAYRFVWGSPPCQDYSIASKCRPKLAGRYPRLIDDTRALMEATALDWVIENVYLSPLKGVMLCGAMFGFPLYRHRLFESNLHLWMPEHPRHTVKCSRAGHWKPGTYVSVAGCCAPIKMAREAMDIDWMNRHELAESIPPYFSEFIGRQIIEAL